MKLIYSPANMAWVFYYGLMPTRMGDAPMFFENREDAVLEASIMGLNVSPSGHVSTV